MAKSDAELKQSIAAAHEKLINRRLKELDEEGERFRLHLNGEKQLFPEEEFVEQLDKG